MIRTKHAFIGVGLLLIILCGVFFFVLATRLSDARVEEAASLPIAFVDTSDTYEVTVEGKTTVADERAARIAQLRERIGSRVEADEPVIQSQPPSTETPVSDAVSFPAIEETPADAREEEVTMTATVTPATTTDSVATSSAEIVQE